MALTSEDYFTQNRANVARFAPEMDAAQAMRDRIWGETRGRALAQYSPEAVTRGYNTAAEATALDKKRYGFTGSNGLLRRAILPAAGFAAAPVLLGALGGGAAVSGPMQAAATSAAGTGAAAGTAGGGMTLGNMWNLANLGVGSVSSIFGQRASNRAANQQMALAEREMAMRAAADAEARAEAKRQFDAQQANEARRFAAEDEERAFSRQDRERDRRLLDEREARLAPYRANADRARRRLSAFLGL